MTGLSLLDDPVVDFLAADSFMPAALERAGLRRLSSLSRENLSFRPSNPEARFSNRAFLSSAFFFSKYSLVSFLAFFFSWRKRSFFFEPLSCWNLPNDCFFIFCSLLFFNSKPRRYKIKSRPVDRTGPIIADPIIEQASACEIFSAATC